MRFLLSTTLALGLALAGSVAYAQTTSEEEEHQGMIQEQQGLSNPELSPDEQEQQENVDTPRSHPGVKGQKRTQSTETEQETGAYSPYTTSPQTEKEHLGIEVMAGAGMFNYSSSNARRFTSLGVDYTARVGIGTNRPIAVELAYIGSAQQTSALGLDSSANLISNGVEGVGRINMLTGSFRPYVLGGAAWKRYNLVNKDFNTSALGNDDSVVEFPVGVGLAYHFGQFILDARGDYRFATDEDLLKVGNKNLDNWDVNLKAGVEF